MKAESPGEGKGSTFTVRIPTVTKREITKESSPKTLTRSLRVLLVEDNEDVAETLCEILKMDNHVVHHVSKGLEVIGAAHSFAPDVILLDIGLPDIDGFEVARQLSEQTSLATVPKVAVTGYVQAHDREKAKEVGIEFHIAKPVDFDALRNVLETVSNQ